MVLLFFIDCVVNERKFMPRNKEDFKNIQEQRKAAILDSALHLFAIRGYDSVSIDDITKSAKCSHGLFYHYFRSKENLFHEMMNQIKTRWNNNLETIDFQQKPKFIIREVIDSFLTSLQSDDETAYTIFFFLTFHLQKKIPNPPCPPRPKKERLFHKIIDVIEKGQDEGDFENGNPKEYAILLFTSLGGLAYNRIHLGRKDFIAPKSEILMNLFIRKDVKHA